MHKPLLAMTILTIVFASPFYGQDLSGQSTLTVRTQLVSLDVSVFDKHGKPVLDLTSQDFTVSENGVPQKIVSLEQPSAHLTPPGIQIKSAHDLPLLGSAPITILVLDEMDGLFEENAYARYSLQRFLEKAPSTLQQATALAVETNSSFQLLGDFTRDRDALAETIAHHVPDLSARRMHGGANGAMERVNYNLNTLEQIAKAYAGYPGRKNIIWVGNALPGVSTVDMPNEDATAVNNAVQRCLNILIAAHTVLYTLDPTPESSAEPDLGAEVEAMGADVSVVGDPSAVDPLADGQNYGAIAVSSGGDSIHGRNAIDQAIAETLAVGTSYYTIVYKPSAVSDQSAQYRRISVTVDRPGLTLSSRPGYYANTSADTTAKAESMATIDSRTLLSLDLSSAATSGLSYTALGLHIALDHDRTGLDVHFDLSHGVPNTDEMVLLVATLDNKKRILTHHVYRIAPPSTSAPSNPTLHFPLSAAPRNRLLRVVARNMRTGELGSAELPLNGTEGR